MICPKCQSVLTKAEYQTSDGLWNGWRCILCGHVHDDYMEHNRRHPPERPRTVLNNAISSRGRG